MPRTRPRGRKIITTMRMAPKMTTSKSWKTVSSSGSTVRTPAPRSEPQMLAMPPRTTMVTSLMENMKPKEDGAMKFRVWA